MAKQKTGEINGCLVKIENPYEKSLADTQTTGKADFGLLLFSNLHQTKIRLARWNPVMSSKTKEVIFLRKVNANAAANVQIYVAKR
jgi:hypothetical protein